MLTTQQGTGTFITAKKVKSDEAQRQKRLSQMVGEFVARVSAEGYTSRRHPGAIERACRRVRQKEGVIMVNPKLFLKDQQTPIVLPVQPVSGIGALCGMAADLCRR